jgi:hypothetical protein
MELVCWWQKKMATELELESGWVKEDFVYPRMRMR